MLVSTTRLRVRDRCALDRPSLLTRQRRPLDPHSAPVASSLSQAQFHEYFALVRRVAELQNRKSAAESQVSSLYSNQQRLRDVRLGVNVSHQKGGGDCLFFF